MPDSKAQLELEIIFDETGAITGLKKVNKQADNVGKTGQKSTKKWSDGLKTLKAGYFAIAAVIGVVVAKAIQTVIKPMAEFQNEIAKVGSVTGIARKELELLARKEAKATAFNMQEAAKAMFELGKAGLKTSEDIRNALRPALQLATAGQLGLEEATSTVVKTLTPFGLGMDQAQRAVDVLAKGATSAVTSVSEMAQAMSFVAPIAAKVGFSIEETTAVIGLLANNGVTASRAGTELRRGLISLISPSDKATAVLNKFGITSEDVAKSLDDPVKLFKLLKPAVQDAKDAVTLFGPRAQVLAKVIGDGSTELEGFVDSMNNAKGAAAELEKKQLNTLIGQWKLFLSQVAETRQILGEAVGSISGLQSIVTKLKENLAKLNTFFTETKAGIITLNAGLFILKTAFNVILLPIKTVIRFVSALASAFVTNFEGMFSAVKGLVNIFGLLQRAITSVFSKDKINLEEFKKRMAEIGNNFATAGLKIAETAKNVGKAALSIVQLPADQVKLLIDTVKKTKKEMGELEKAQKKALEGGKKKKKQDDDDIKTVKKKIGLLKRFKKALDKFFIKNNFGKFLKKSDGDLKALGGSVEDTSELFGQLGESIGGNFGEALSTIGEFGKALKSGVVGVVIFVVAQLSKIFSAQKEADKAIKELRDETTLAVLDAEITKGDAEIARLERVKKAKLEEFDNDTELMEKSLLANSKYQDLLEKKEAERIANMTDEELEFFNAKTKFENDLKTLQAKRDIERLEAEKVLNAEINAIKKRNFNIDKQIKLTEIEIERNSRIGEVKGFGKKKKKRIKLINALYDTLSSNISSLSYPGFREGGTVGGVGGEDSQTIRATPNETMINPKGSNNLFNNLKRAGLLSPQGGGIVNNQNSNSRSFDQSSSLNIHGDIIVKANNAQEFGDSLKQLELNTGSRITRRS